MQSTDSLTEEQISELKNLQELKDEKKEVSILVRNLVHLNFPSSAKLCMY